MKILVKFYQWRPQGGQGGTVAPPPITKFMITIFFIFKEKMIFYLLQFIQVSNNESIVEEINCENSFVYKYFRDLLNFLNFFQNILSES